MLKLEDLISWGITADENGNVYRKGKLLPQYEMRNEHTYGKTMSYKRVHIMCNGVRHKLRVNRVVYAYMHQCDIPDGYVIDHIDSNTFNNHIDNLQMITTKENNNKMSYTGNQYLNNLTDDEIKEYKDINEKILDANYVVDMCKDLIKNYGKDENNLHLLTEAVAKLKQLKYEKKVLLDKFRNNHKK